MMSLRPYCISAFLALLFFASAAAINLSSPINKHLSSEPINVTNSSLKAPPGHLQNLTYTPWPAQPYQIPIYPRFSFPHLTIIRAREFHGTRTVSVPRLQEFLREFGDNLAREHPVPGYVPRLAYQYTIDIQSYTEWRIKINEGLLGNSLPTEVALVALDEIAEQLRSHGPARLFFSIVEGISTHSYGFLEIQEFGHLSLNLSLANGNSIFQTN